MKLTGFDAIEFAARRIVPQQTGRSYRRARHGLDRGRGGGDRHRSAGTNLAGSLGRGLLRRAEEYGARAIGDDAAEIGSKTLSVWLSGSRRILQDTDELCTSMTSGSSRSAMVGSAHPTLSADRWSLTQAAIVNRLIVAQLMLNPAWWFQVAQCLPPVDSPRLNPAVDGAFRSIRGGRSFSSRITLR